MIMSLEELDRELLSDEERLVSSLEEYKNAKATLRKARITSISNKLLAPFRRFRIEQAIAKYDAMIERIEKKREKEIRRAEKLQEKEVRLERKQAKEDFKAAIRDKRKEDIVNFVNDKKDDIISFGEEIGKEVSDTFSYIKETSISRVSSASSFISNVKTSLIVTLDKKTTLHRDIESKILNYRENKANRDYEKAVMDAKARQIQEEINNSIAREREFSDDVTIRQRFNKINKNKSYMGTATNRVVDYFRGKKNKLDDKIFDAKVEVAVIGAKVSRAKSKVAMAFNSQINNLKNKADNFIGNTIVAVDNTYNNIKEGINDKVNQVASAMEHRSEVKQRKEDMISAINEEEKRRNKIREEQLNMRRDLINNINNGDIFEGATPVIDGGMKR